MISVAEAVDRVLQGVAPLPSEHVMLSEAHGRILARDLVSRRTQPPLPVSAMDGYAVRAEDVRDVPVTLKRIGAVPAGRLFEGTVGRGETVRIFTGAALPDGADTVVIQENVEAEQSDVRVLETAALGRNVRKAGIDFREGEIGLAAGRLLTARDIGLAAAMNHPWVPVRRRPRIAILATGDEIALPGNPVAPGQIVSSSGPAMMAFVAECGGDPVNLGVATDDPQAIRDAATGAASAEILITLGGASVGDHDLVQSALAAQGLEVDFWKIAMRPGKPLMFGRMGGTLVLGLPGNPVSTMVCALLFLRPLIAAMLGRPIDRARSRMRLGVPMAANDVREDYVRAKIVRDQSGEATVEPFPVQDSSMLSLLARSDCLIVRPPHAPAAPVGASVEIIPLEFVGI